MKKTLFTMLLHPVEATIAAISDSIDQESNSQKLLFADFVRKLIFGYVSQVGSLRNLALELQTNPISRALGFEFTPFSTLKDGFSRFDSRHFKQLFEAVLAGTKLLDVPFLDELGIFRVIDGSLFPTLGSMKWTQYRKRKNAFKLHLSFDLNRMIPIEFWIGSGNSSERAFLAGIIEEAVTYIADRGYFSFALIDQVMQAGAFFIFRGKENLLYKRVEELARDVTLPGCFKRVTDEIVILTGDERQSKVRQITFWAAGSYFRLLTNRFDLTTLEVIILYAYRWQIELFFKFMKRTVNGIHLLNHSENGVEIQFYVLMLTALLMLILKQHSGGREEAAKEAEEWRKTKEKDQRSPSKWIKEIGRIFYGKWKISKSWLIAVRNSLAQEVDTQLLRLIDST